jgi:FtsH-binding integral membrane protein
VFWEASGPYELFEVFNFMSFINSMRERGIAAASYDVGLRSYMLRVYNYMASALGISGLVAYIVSVSPTLLNLIYGTPLQFVFMLAPIVMAVLMSTRVNSMSLRSTHTCFWAFAGLMGVSLSSIFLLYTGTSVARVFFISASAFGAMSLYGYTTKRDLTGVGSFMIMGLLGIVIASLFNLFIRSSALQFATSVLGVVIFVGLTAYDAQRIKEIYARIGGGDGELVEKASVMGALTLYMDFINLFVSMMHLFGQRK